jgi:hypothetical protein
MASIPLYVFLVSRFDLRWLLMFGLPIFAVSIWNFAPITNDWGAVELPLPQLMEATGVNWKTVWHLLEEHFELVLVNAQHIRNVPGRKTDVNDATWIAASNIYLSRLGRLGLTISISPALTNASPTTVFRITAFASPNGR